MQPWHPDYGRLKLLIQRQGLTSSDGTEEQRRFKSWNKPSEQVRHIIPERKRAKEVLRTQTSVQTTS